MNDERRARSKFGVRCFPAFVLKHFVVRAPFLPRDPSLALPFARSPLWLPAGAGEGRDDGFVGLGGDVAFALDTLRRGPKKIPPCRILPVIVPLLHPTCA